MKLSQSLKLLIPLISASVVNFILPNKLSAEVSLHSPCPESGTLTNAQFASEVNPACYSKPDSYQVKIIEIGMCKDNPLATSSLLTTSCAILFSNSDGLTIDLASGGSLLSKVALSGATVPAKDTYLFAYIVMDDSSFKISASYETTERTWYSSSSTSEYNENYSGWKTTSPSEAATYSIAGFGTGNCSEGVSHESLNLTGAFLDTNYEISTPVGDDCPNATYMAMSQSLANSVTITSDNPEIDVQFDLTSYGALIIGQESSPDFSAGVGLGFPIINIVTNKT